MSSTIEPRRTQPEMPVVSGAVPQQLLDVLRTAGFSNRQRTALSARFGLAGHGPVTLAEAGRSAGYTRERVRQLEDRLRSHAACAEAPFTAVAKALQLAEQLAPAPASNVAAELVDARLLPPGFELSGLFRIADVLGLEHDLRDVDAAVLRTGDVSRYHETVEVARRLARLDGVGDVARLAQELNMDASRVRRLLALHRDVVWLDHERRWFFLRGCQSRAWTLARKMLTVSGPLTVTEVQDGLRRARRPVRAPDHVVAGLCALSPWLVVDRKRRTITLKVALDANRTHSPIELAIVRIFAEHGPTLTVSEVVAWAEGLGLNRMSIRVYLTRMPALERVGRGRYALRGGGAGVRL
jgi:hypothetical protein